MLLIRYDDEGHYWWKGVTYNGPALLLLPRELRKDWRVKTERGQTHSMARADARTGSDVVTEPRKATTGS